MFNRPGRDKLEETLYQRWLKSEEFKNLLKKIIDDNKRIEEAVKMMEKKLLKENGDKEKVMEMVSNG